MAEKQKRITTGTDSPSVQRNTKSRNTETPNKQSEKMDEETKNEENTSKNNLTPLENSTDTSAAEEEVDSSSFTTPTKDPARKSPSGRLLTSPKKLSASLEEAVEPDGKDAFYSEYERNVKGTPCKTIA